MSGSRKQAGFTLIELIAVVSIIVVLAVVFAYVLAAAQERARVATCASNLRQVGMGLSAYGRNNRGVYPLANTRDSTSGAVGRWNGPGHTTTNDNFGVSLLRFVWNTPAAKLPDDTPVPANYPLYVSSWRVFYCPSTITAKMFHVSVEDWCLNRNWFSYKSTPDITYNYANGNSPGWDNNAAAQWYRGKQVARPGDNYVVPSNVSDCYAAGYVTDSPNWILMADMAQININKQFDIDGLASNDSEYPTLNHRSGFNTLYNDGRVGFTPVSSSTVSPAKYYALEFWYQGSPANLWYIVYAPK